jgi:membrane-bound ClpP family serine protease
VPHVLLLDGGAALVAVELFLMPGTIWLGLWARWLMLFGLVWSFTGSRIGFEYGLDRVILLDESFRVLGAGALALVVIVALSRVLPHTPILSRMVLAGGGPAPAAEAGSVASVRVGATGRAETPLRPFGKVVLDEDAGTLHAARAEGSAIDAGARVRVIEIQLSGRLVVALAADTSAARGHAECEHRGRAARAGARPHRRGGLLPEPRDPLRARHGGARGFGRDGVPREQRARRALPGRDALLVPATIVLAFKLFPKSPLGKRMVVSGPTAAAAPADDPRVSALVGKEGVVESDCRPAGMVRLDGRRLDVVTRGEWIGVGERVRVLEAQGNRVVVARAEATR